MNKKTISKKRKTNKKKSRNTSKSQQSINIEEKLIENFISIQKVMTHLSIKFDNLSNNISKLLELFEISAKSFAEKDIDTGKENEENKEILEKINSILDQNKIIAKGLTLLHEKPLENEKPKEYENTINQKFQNPMKNGKETNFKEYEKSVYTEPPKFNPLPKK